LAQVLSDLKDVLEANVTKTHVKRMASDKPSIKEADEGFSE
jgi:hypothetical protein